MKKILLILILINISQFCLSQVGINTTTPNSQLDVRSSNQATPSSTDGILIPKIDAFPVINPTAAQQAMMVYLTTATTFSGNPKSIGFYYWDNVSSDWISVGNNQTSGWAITGNTGINATTHFIGSTNNADVVFRRNNVRAGLLGGTSTSFGTNALNTASTGVQNSAFGQASMQFNTTGSQNAAFGASALQDNTTGADNTAIGAIALANNTSGFGNTAVGRSALLSLTTGFANNAFGRMALAANVTGNNNAAFGSGALENSTASSNAAFGVVALNANTTGTSNSAVGFGALFQNTTGNSNTAVGDSALSTNATGGQNSAFGHNSLQFNTATGNSAFGFHTLRLNTTGINNAAFGTSSLDSNTTGQENSAFGNNTLQSNTTGASNTAFGHSSLYSNTTGTFNTSVGAYSLQANTTGQFNSALGYLALDSNTVGNFNTTVGVGSLILNTTGNSNIAFGASALPSNTTGSSNSAFGNLGLNNNTTGTLNSSFGFNTDVASGNLTNATAIGAYAEVATSNSMVLGSINGVNGATASVNVGIGTSSPQTRLDIMDENAVTSFATDGNLLVRTNNPQVADIGGSITLGGMIDDAALLPRNFGSIEGRKTSSVNNSNSGYLLFKTNNAGTFSEKMRITNVGDVGIGTTTPGGQFELSLNEGRKPGSTTWTVVSDNRLKTIDGTYTKGLNEIVQLQPIRYHYKNNGDRKFEQEVLDTEFSGFIAQEVQPLFPDAVQEDEDGFLNFNMHSILVASINAIKELNAKIEDVKMEKDIEKNSNLELQTKVTTLEERIKKLEELLIK